MASTPIQFKGVDLRNKKCEITGGNLFDLVTVNTNNPPPCKLSICVPTGRLVYVGITTETISSPTQPSCPEITILASRSKLPKDFPRIIELIEQGTINTDPWITHHVDFSEVDKRFAEVTIHQLVPLRPLLGG